MTCERMREAASARLDGEPIGLPVATLDAHLAGCAGCAAWLAGAERLARRTRISAEPVPDLAAAIVADVATPATRVRRRLRWLRAALGAVGVLQLAVAAPAVFGDSMAMAMGLHAAHESAAWNAALGVAFLATAARPRRAAGLLPLLIGFVAVLTVLSVRDVALGNVPLPRLLTHTGCVLGLALVALLARRAADVDADPGRAAGGVEDAAVDDPGLRGVA